MQLRIVVASGTVAFLVGLFACTDLFHSTADLRSRCDIDPASCATQTFADAGADAAPSETEAAICVSDHDAAATLAAHACAWLGACESPLGHNALGACTVDALLAFDCTLNPLHPVKGVTNERWHCLSGVTSCQDVARCFFSEPTPPSCAENVSSSVCLPQTDDTDVPTVRFSCIDGGPTAEDCSLWGQDCVASGTSTSCGAAGDGGLTCDAGGNQGICLAGNPQTKLHWCTDNAEVGTDCSSNGAQRCAGFPAAEPEWVACAPEETRPDASCSPSRQSTCAGSTATSCAEGVVESLDCQRLLGVAGSCQSTFLDPPFDWTSPCAVSPSACSGDTCEDGGTLVGCARGATFAVKCSDQNLGPCRIIGSDDGVERAACAPPGSP